MLKETNRNHKREIMNQKEASSTFVFDKRVRGTIIDSLL